MSYAEDLGDRLRRVRQQLGLSLQDVEQRSGGNWKAAALGSYERGDRNVSATRLIELANFYGVPIDQLLPAEEKPGLLAERRAALVFDLTRLEDVGEELEGVKRYCEAIRVQRGDFNREVLTVRADDLNALAVITSTVPENLVASLRERGALREAA